MIRGRWTGGPSRGKESRTTSIFPCDGGKVVFAFHSKFSDRRPAALQGKQGRGIGRPILRPMRLCWEILFQHQLSQLMAWEHKRVVS